MAKDCGAAKYMECSAFNLNGLKDIFDAVVQIVLYPPKPVKEQKLPRYLPGGDVSIDEGVF